MIAYRLLGLGLLFALIVPATLSAQTCLGGPAGAGQSSIGIEYRSANSTSSWLLKSARRGTGGFVADSEFGLMSIEGTDVRPILSGTTLGYRLPTRELVSVCGFVGLEAVYWRDLFSPLMDHAAELVVPAGLGVGADYPVTDRIRVFGFGLFGTGVYGTFFDGESLNRVEDLNRFVRLGAGASAGPVFVRLSAGKALADGVDWGLALAGGLMF